MSRTYIAIDLETTGLNPSRDRILEIGAAKVVDGVVTDTYSVFVDCGVRVPEYITNLTGITDEMAQSGISTEHAMKEIVDFCRDYEILGHNVLFDFSFLKRNAVNLNLTFEKNGIDTLRIARCFLPELPSRSLEALCGHYGIDREHKHRALDDAIATVVLYERLREEFYEKAPEVFAAKPLIFKVKKQSPITNSQKGYLNDLAKYHRIELDAKIETLTKSEASRLIDHIILNYGKIKR